MQTRIVANQPTTPALGTQTGAGTQTGILQSVTSILGSIGSIIGIGRNNNANAGIYTAGNLNYTNQDDSNKTALAVLTGLVIVAAVAYFMFKKKK